jgi:hypothetical protein
LRHIVREDWSLLSATHSSGRGLEHEKAVDNFVGNFVPISDLTAGKFHQIFEQASRKKIFLQNHNLDFEG